MLFKLRNWLVKPFGLKAGGGEENFVQKFEELIRSGSPADLANKGCRIWYRVAAHDETPPATPTDLHESFSTRRKKEVIEFDFEDSGKTAYFAVQVENDGKKGSWGPLTSALIP
jgi:hypothetical protein